MKGILDLTSIFIFQNKFSHRLLLNMQFADYAGKIAAGALIQTNTISFGTVRTFLHFSDTCLNVKDCFIKQANENTHV
jgi:hypothetical protein